MIRFDNYAKKIGKRGEYDWYEWMVFVDEDEETLNKIDHVEYLLHPTFPKPRRLVFDRNAKFALISNGWGQFNLKMRITFKDGTQRDTSYYLDLHKEWPG